MAGLALSPVSSHWLVALLLLLSAAEPVPATKSEDLYPNPKGSACSRIWQSPRFIARKRGFTVKMHCYVTNSTFSIVSWLRKREMDKKPQQECSKTSEVYLGCGTELRVMGFSTLAQLKQRNTLKDGIIMIQTLLIILFIIVPIFLLLDKDDSKAGTEEDHTYEGLDIDQTATYEDIVTLRTGEVKWSVGEHPGQE
uniref:CD79b molecule n=1 Tax=Rhinopithecus bieti TaxID=61621 RepID=A0A2K6LB97_RHIBE